MASAEVATYVRYVITEQDASVWLAQREGRAKDGDDRTSPALIRMLLNGEDAESWNRLKVQPVSLSYEWDPCDGMKVRELLIREANDGEYVKASGEDERSMKQGLFGWKAAFMAFCNPAAWEELPEGVRPAALGSSCGPGIARIHAYVAVPTLGCRRVRLTGKRGANWPVDGVPDVVDAEVGEAVEAHSNHSGFPDRSSSQRRGVRLKWCEITMNPLVNAMLAERILL